MSYREEPTLQELIAGSIDKKKSADSKGGNLSQSKRSDSFNDNNDVEIGEEFVEREIFRNSSSRAYDVTQSLDPEFLKNLRENFGNNSDRENLNFNKHKKKEFELKIENNDFENLPTPPQSVRATVRRLPAGSVGTSRADVRAEEKLKMKKHRDYDFDEEDFEYERYDEYEQTPVRPEKKRKKKKKRIFSKIFTLLLIAAVVAMGVIYSAISKYAGLFNYVPDENRLDIQNVVSDENVFNLLLIGSDTRKDGSYGLSDSMILLSLNKQSKEVVISSFMRDMYVEIPGQETPTMHKLNWAHSRGGAELLMDTLEHNFGVEIDYYLRVDFNAFANIIDAAGGLEIEISDAEAAAMIDPLAEQNNIFSNQKGTDYLYAGGAYHMNGNQALAYSRIRKGVGDDFSRTDRQREVIGLIAEKVKGMGIKELDGFAEKVIPNFTTNMEKQTVKKLLASLPVALKYSRVSQRIPYGKSGESWNYGTSQTDGSVIIPDLELNRKFLKETIYKQ